MPPALCPSLLSLPLGRLLLCRALDQCADPTASPHYLFFLPSVLCMCQPFNCPHTSLLEKTLVTALNISDCAFCVMHVVAIPDHRTQILFAQSILPYLHLSQTYIQGAQTCAVHGYMEGLEPVTFAVTFLSSVGCSL